MELFPVKVLLVALTLLSSFALLVQYIPNEFAMATKDYRVTDYPSYFDIIDVTNFTATHLMNVTSDLYTEFWGPNQGFGHSFYAWAELDRTPVLYGTFANEHYYPFWVLFWEIQTGAHSMDWIDRNGTTYTGFVNSTIIQNNYDTNSSRFTVHCEHLSMACYFGWNQTLYANCTDAWDNHGLQAFWGIGWDQVGSTMNTQNILGALLFFQLPEIHPLLNSFIAIPLWIVIIYLIAGLAIAFAKALPFT